MTLIELMVAAVLLGVTIAAVMATFLTFGTLMRRQTGTARSLTQGQEALRVIEQSVRLAGTGIDPGMAFDFDYYKCALPGGVTLMTDSAHCGTATRDAVNRPDDLVLAYRDPAFSVTAPADVRAGCSSNLASTYVGRVWGVGYATSTSVMLTLKPGDTIYRGQVLQLACADGVTYTYATVSSAKTTVTGSACATVTLSLYPSVANDPFNQPGYLTANCYNNGSARAYAVKRQRYFVRSNQVTQTSTPVTSNTVRPYLMLDEGLDLNDDGRLDDNDVLPIAADIEDLQVAYGTAQPGLMALPTPPTGWSANTFVVDSNRDGVWGNDSGATNPEQMTGQATVSGNIAHTAFAAANQTLQNKQPYSCSAYATNAMYSYPCLYGLLPVESTKSGTIHAYRWVAWPGNIATVLVGIIARTAKRDTADVAPTESYQLPALLNRGAAASVNTMPAWYQRTLPGGRHRVALMTGVSPVNMSVYTPMWR